MDKRFLIVGAVILFLITASVLGYIIISTKAPSGAAASSAAVINQSVMKLGDIKKLLEQGQTETALKNLKILIVKSPGSAEALTAYFLLGSTYEKSGELLNARDAYQKLVEKFPASGEILKAQEALENVNVQILFSPIPTPDSVSYEVQKGDTLTRIAKKYGTTVELIAKANGLKNNAIRVGENIKINKSRFSIAVDKSQNILTLKDNENILKTYRVSTGKNSCTPVGTFKITTKIVDPPWYPPTGGVVQSGDPKNVLGSRWLGISKEGYGIHGTIEPESIGRSVTEGCVRMKNAEVEELYTIVPEGTEVLIVD
ncbi:MAG: L,D-transpeptidase family protein [Candidatus Omnitrophota bacterium]